MNSYSTPNTILKMMSELNNSKTIHSDSYNLFTINVEKLYLSIQKHLAKEAIDNLISNIGDEEVNMADVEREFVKISFNESYVAYKDRVFKSII